MPVAKQRACSSYDRCSDFYHPNGRRFQLPASSWSGKPTPPRLGPRPHPTRLESRRAGPQSGRRRHHLVEHSVSGLRAPNCYEKRGCQFQKTICGTSHRWAGSTSPLPAPIIGVAWTGLGGGSNPSVRGRQSLAEDIIAAAASLCSDQMKSRWWLPSNRPPDRGRSTVRQRARRFHPHARNSP